MSQAEGGIQVFPNQTGIGDGMWISSIFIANDLTYPTQNLSRLWFEAEVNLVAHRSVRPTYVLCLPRLCLKVFLN